MDFILHMRISDDNLAQRLNTFLEHRNASVTNVSGLFYIADLISEKDKGFIPSLQDVFEKQRIHQSDFVYIYYPTHVYGKMGCHIMKEPNSSIKRINLGNSLYRY